jgi:hypothetical protein
MKILLNEDLEIAYGSNNFNHFFKEIFEFRDRYHKNRKRAQSSDFIERNQQYPYENGLGEPF